MAEADELKEKTKKLGNEMDVTSDDMKSLGKQLQNLAREVEGINFNEMRETRITIDNALRVYGNEVKKETQAVKDADYTTRQLKLQGDRLRRSYGQFSDGLIATYRIQSQNNKQAQAQYSLAQAAVTQAKALLRANGEAITAQNEKVSGLRSELGSIKEAIKQKQQERLGTLELIEGKKEEAAYVQSQITVAKDEIAAIDERKSAIREANKALQEQADSSRDLERYMQSQITAASDEVQASKDKVKSLEANRDAQNSQIAALQKEIAIIEDRSKQQVTDRRGAPSKKTELTKEEQSLIAEMMARKESIRAAFEASKTAIVAEKARTKSLEETIPGMQAERDSAIEATTAYESAISKNNELLGKEGMARFKLTEDTLRMSSEIDKLTTEQQNLEQESAKLLSETRKLGGKARDTSKALNDAIIEQKQLNENQSELSKAYEDKVQELKAKEQEKLNTRIKGYQEVLGKAQQITSKVANELNKLVDSIRGMQQQFGLSAGSAAKLKFENLAASIKSYTTMFASLGQKTAVSAKEIETTQQAFQAEFGGVLTAEAASGIAAQAKEMGVGASELAKARRVFMTQTMGDTGKAKAAQDKFVAEFAKKGLTAKDAMAAIGQNSELLARNGTRFASSFARAAADAKKIGVDLSKVDQIGDSIIGDFEGFLEKTSELGAMGFNLDTTRLAETAESGDTGALFNELRSQLAATGKDITKLRRSEQLALSQTFGISMEEMQRMAAGGEGGSGEATLSPEELQKDANKSLSKLVNLAEGLGVVLAGIATTLGIIASNTAMGALKSVLGGGPSRVAGRVASSAPSRLVSRVAGSGVGRFSTAPIRAVSRTVGRLGVGGVLAGALGGFEGFQTARKSGKGGYEAGGNAAVQGGAAAGGTLAGSALGAAIGTAILPGIGTVIGQVVGAGIGGFVGNTLGKAINKYFPSLGANIGLVFKGMISAIEPLKKAFGGVWENIKKLGEPLSKIMNLFGGTTDKANNLWPILELVGNFMGTALLLPLNLLGTTLGLASGAITSIAQLLTGDFAGAWETVKSTLSNSFAWIVEPITKAIDATKGVFASIINWIIDKVNLLPGIEIEKIGTKKGDDVVSQPGYGKRSLVTPSGVIALNNRDNIVAYADDLMGTTKLPIGSISKMASDQFPILDQFKNKVTEVFSGLTTSSGPLGKISQFISSDLGATLTSKLSKTKESIMGTFTGISGGLTGSLKGFASKLPGASALMNLGVGGVEGVKQKALGFASKLPGVGSLLSGGLGGLKEKALGSIAGKLPGLSSVSKIYSGFKTGGISGGLKSLAGAGTGKAIGGALGTLIPIPGVGTMLGSLAGGTIGKGIGKLFAKDKDGKSMAGKIAKYSPTGLAARGLNKFADSKIGKYSPIGVAKNLVTSKVGKSIMKYSPAGLVAGGVGKLFGKKKKDDVTTATAGMMTAQTPELSTMLGAQTKQQPTVIEQQKPAVVDTSGIEQKLNNFINALQGIQINMDGTKVGNVLVNSSNAATSLGVMNVQSRMGTR